MTMTMTMSTPCTPYSPVAGGASTVSKYDALFPANAPVALARASGATVWDLLGRPYTDWISALLAVTLGHNHPEVTEAVTRHLTSGGPSWSLPHVLEEQVAATIRQLAGYPDGQVRFFKTGSEACAAALRIARAVTGRTPIISSGYHGWHDSALVTPPAWGVPAAWRAATTVYPFQQLPRPTRGDERPAAIIVEPETLDAPVRGYLQGLRGDGALLIFDECITGGRYPEYTAGQHYGVQPDLTVLSKSLANGYPLACVVGPRSIMRCFDVDWSPDAVIARALADGRAPVSGPVYCSGTYAGETASLAAAAATLRVWQRDGVAAHLHRIGRVLGRQLQATIAAAGETARVTVKGQPYRLAIDGSPAVRTALLARLLEHGHLLGAGCNLTLAHTLDDVDCLTVAFRDALRRLDEPLPDGRVVAAPYRQA